MANIKSAKKRSVQSERQRKHNTSLRSTYRTYVKKVEIAIKANKKEEALTALKKLIPVLDKMARKKIISNNKAARHKSLLNAGTKKLT